MEEAVLVLDVGKSRTKLQLVDHRGKIVAARSRRNQVCKFEFGAALDTAQIQNWIKRELHGLSRSVNIAAVVPVAHGAAAALVDCDQLVAPVMDYESELPPNISHEYDKRRGDFHETLSPRLPNGLNLGAQLFWQDQIYPQKRSPTTKIVLWPQYWAWWLSGQLASEVTSLGCHTDMWRPLAHRYSGLTMEQHWDRRIPTLAAAGDVVGTIRPELASEVGIETHCRVFCGIHDSNAALHGLRATDPTSSSDISIVSTGTWFIAMRAGAVSMPPLNPNFDTLANVGVDGNPIPTARFMGGREYELMMRGDLAATGSRDAVRFLVERGAQQSIFYDPTVGKFAAPSTEEWTSESPELKASLTALYLALNTDALLAHIGSRGPIIVEGRFAHNDVFLAALATLRSETDVHAFVSADGVALGAARLVWPEVTKAINLSRAAPLMVDLRRPTAV